MNFCLNPRTLFIFVLLTAGIVQAQTTTTPVITIDDVSGGELVKSTSTTVTVSPKIYGAASTNANLCSQDVAGDGMLPCNPKTIIPGSTLTIFFTWNKADSVGNRLVLTVVPKSGGQPVLLSEKIIPAVGGNSISANWDNIKASICPGPDWTGCDAFERMTLAIGMDVSPLDGQVDPALGVTIQGGVEVFDGAAATFSTACPEGSGSASGDAICNFSVFPGDEKFFFDDLTPATSDLTNGNNGVNTGYQALQIFFKKTENLSDEDTLLSMINSDPSTSIGITSDDDFDINLTDLENDTRYCVIFAGVTNAGTITKYFPNNTASIPNASDYCNTPSEVFGLLDNKKCFVATAAYGSELDPHVQTFRVFRNQILMRSAFGRKLTQFYYAHSPEYAKIISQEPILKAGVRGVLWVLLLFVQLSLKFGLMLTILGCTFLFLLSYRSVEFAYIRNKKVQNRKLQNRNSRFFGILLIGLFAAPNFVSVPAEAQSNANADEEFLFQEIDHGSELKASQKKVKKKQETLVEQEVKSEPMPEDSLFDTTANPVEPQSLFSEEPRQPEIPVVNEPEVFIPEDRTEELKSAWDRPIEDRVVKDLVKKEEGVHYYKINKQSGSRQSKSFKIGFMPPPNITNTLTDANGNENVVTYKDIYPEPTVLPVGLYEYEWSPIKNWSLLKAQFGVGGFYAQGSGRFANGLEAREKYTFIGIPMFLGAKLRMQIGNAWLVPYVAGGGSYYGLIELRDDGLKRNIVGSPAVYGGGGLMFDLTHFDRETSWIFDREYDISHLWLTAELRVVKSFARELDFSSNMILVGVSADY